MGRAGKAGRTGWAGNVVGSALLITCVLWVSGAADDVVMVAPVHWPMLLPWLTVSGVPALIGTFTATALIFGKPGARALTLAFFITLAQAALLSYLSPEIEQRYEDVVAQGKQLVKDSLP